MAKLSPLSTISDSTFAAACRIAAERPGPAAEAALMSLSGRLRADRLAMHRVDRAWTAEENAISARQLARQEVVLEHLRAVWVELAS